MGATGAGPPVKHTAYTFAILLIMLNSFPGDPIILAHGNHALWVVDDVGALATIGGLENALDNAFCYLCDSLWAAVGRGLVVELTLVDDAAMQALNWEHRQQDKPTDVLTFPQFESLASVATAFPPDPEPVTLGNSVVSVTYAKAHCASETRVATYPNPLLAYITDRVCHSALHLSGRHHTTMPDYEAVVAFQDALLQQVLAEGVA